MHIANTLFHPNKKENSNKISFIINHRKYCTSVQMGAKKQIH